jgi:hypothetical protein
MAGGDGDAMNLDIDYSERDGFLVGKSAALAEWAHRKEARESAEQFRRLADRQAARMRRAAIRLIGGPKAERVREGKRRWIAAARAQRREAKILIRRRPIICAECGVEFCHIGRTRMPIYCTEACRRRAASRKKRVRVPSPAIACGCGAPIGGGKAGPRPTLCRRCYQREYFQRRKLAELTP